MASPTRPRAGRADGVAADDRRVRELRILEAAAGLLARWGYRKTTVDDVARTAGVGKGTIYLHWPDKTALCRAAIWHASEKATATMVRRMADDPEGGHFYRLWTHGMVAIYSDPLLAAIMSGRTDLLRGLVDSLEPGTTAELFGNSQTQIERLQAAGLIRDDVAPSVIAFMITSLKLGIIDAAALTPAPTPEELTEALSDVMRRWLEPATPPTDSSEGKRIIAEWLEQTHAIFGQGADTEAREG